MIRVIKHSLAGLAVAGLAFAQPAMAATRSADSLPSVSSKIGTQTSRVGSARQGEDFVGVPPVAIILGVAIIIAFFAAIVDDSNEPDSPG